MSTPLDRKLTKFGLILALCSGILLPLATTSISISSQYGADKASRASLEKTLNDMRTDIKQDFSDIRRELSDVKDQTITNTNILSANTERDAEYRENLEEVKDTLVELDKSSEVRWNGLDVKLESLEKDINDIAAKQPAT